jgi:hypothetical protein
LHRAAAAGAREKPAFQPSTPGLAGDTLDVEPPAEPADSEEEEPSNEPAAVGRSLPSPPVPREAAERPPSSTSARARSSASAGAPAAAVPPSLFGAVGVRSAADLATTFTRAFPQAASADPIWSTASFGSAGTAELTVVLDESGHVSKSTISGSPSPALRRGIDRTLVLLGARPFTAHGAVTRLRIAAHVSRNDVHDGLHGDVFALSGGSFSGDVGAAFFALPAATGGGRRIDVELRLLASP